MSAHCCSAPTTPAIDPKYHRALWVALAVNATMFVVEVVASWSSDDALGNLAVMLAALGVFGTGSAWPDLLVAAIMGALALSGAYTVLHHARRELAPTVSTR